MAAPEVLEEAVDGELAEYFVLDAEEEFGEVEAAGIGGNGNLFKKRRARVVGKTEALEEYLPGRKGSAPEGTADSPVT